MKTETILTSPSSQLPYEPTSPEGEKKILSFEVHPHQKGGSTIADDVVKFVCKLGTDVRALFPQVKLCCIAFSERIFIRYG